ncbi:hypothetical protein ABL78_3142 [Leptomonas seymouri]|uniref:IQ motif and ubiquitin-like domain-containing protein n=1 Tax=Leptomonas seymouri TaxID=5684 RepID=A0A0N1ILI1_LEPSE|nr:hypothetical protein ABL78_3142 [Leptomonas seymouri]|eukprot:KPI87784.1 hypothetical protein ABL78_3142 [Leptomonas seymouri]
MEDSSTDPARVEQQTTAGSPEAVLEHDSPEEDAIAEQEGPSSFSHLDTEGDNSEVGHEALAPRATPDPNDVGYYARQHPHEDDLADNVASDVRRVPSEQQRQSSGSGPRTPEYEDIAVQDVEKVEQSGGNGTAGETLQPADASDVPVQFTTLARQPCCGTQVDAGAEMPVGADHHDDVADEATAAAESPQPGIDTLSSGAHDAVQPRWSLLPQAAHGTAEVTATLFPMQALARITVPVHNPNLYRPPPNTALNDECNDEGEGYENGGVGQRMTQEGRTDGSPYWVLMAKDLFEALAAHLNIHPESFHIFHQHKRLRFMSALFLDCDATSTPTPNSSAAAAGVIPTEINRAEPAWVSVIFPSPNAVKDAVAAAMGGTDVRSQPPFKPIVHDTADEEEEAQASLAGVPAHLSRLGPEDYIAHCIRVRRRKAQIPPRTLVEGRRQGYSYDEVIQQMQSLHDAAVVEEGSCSSDGTAASNFTVITIVQDSPAPPTKPFLGGYRDKRLPDHVLLHAATQLYHRDLEYSPFAKSGAAVAAAGGIDRTSRQTQTFGISRSCQTNREACVQTPRVDLLLDTSHDFVVVARPYFTSAALKALRDEMAVVIQKLYRQWKARQVRRELEAEESARQHRAGARQRREEALHAAVEDAAQLRLDDPRSAADFERVKQDIIAWRVEEAARIQRDATLPAQDARAALLAITRKELQLLQQLDQRRRGVGRTREEMLFVRNLDRMAAPKQWGTVFVFTPETERAGELRDLYERLVQTSGSARSGIVGGSSTRMMGSAKADAMSGSHSQGAFPLGFTPQGSSAAGTPQSGKSAATLNASGTPAFAAISGGDSPRSVTAARLDILLRVKWTVREFNATSALARELGELIDREADLLHRGRKDASLSGLRKRIQTLFAQFTEDPEYNPGVKDFVQTARGRARVKAMETEKRLPKAKTQKSRT